MDWKHNEVLVSALYRAESIGADVKWNERISGRQFDVTVRFKLGLHDYLTVVECKAVKKKVQAEKVEALVTKATDAGANKAVMVSTAGYQPAAIGVARKHNVELLTLVEGWAEPELSGGEKLIPVASIFDVEIRFQSGKPIRLDNSSKLQYLANQIRFSDPEGVRTLNDLIAPFARYDPELIRRQRRISIDLPQGTEIAAGLDCRRTPISVQFTLRIVDGIASSGPMLDSQMQQMLARRYELVDVDGNVVSDHSILGLDLGVDEDIEPDNFYMEAATGNFFYCHSIEDDMIRWFCVESYQHGILWQAEILQRIKHATNYIRVANSKKISQLRELLHKLEVKKQSNNQS